MDICQIKNKDEKIYELTLKQCWGSGSTGFASFCQIRTHKISINPDPEPHQHETWDADLHQNTWVKNIFFFQKMTHNLSMRIKQNFASFVTFSKKPN